MIKKTLRIGTFNLYQFVEPPYSWYDKKSTFSKIRWDEKTTWIKDQITKMNCNIIGFQEVFTPDALKNIVKELGFDYFITVDKAKVDREDSRVFISTTVALASKYPILEIQEVVVDNNSILKHNFDGDFKFSRTPIKALIELPNKQKVTVYVNHFKSNRENELEYVFNKNHTLKEKLEKTKEPLEKNISKSLKQRLCETSSLYYDFKNIDTPIICMCDLNDKEFSLTIEALTNEAYHHDNKENSYLLHDVYDLNDKEIYNPHPEQKEIKRIPTSYFQGVGNVLDYIFVSNEFQKKEKNSIGKVTSYEVFNTHLHNNPHGSLIQSDHAQVVCEIEIS
jgi:endonuclease/exonuclease/phosphatase family metal-dependent hydrolase